MDELDAGLMACSGICDTEGSVDTKEDAKVEDTPLVALALNDPTADPVNEVDATIVEDGMLESVVSTDEELDPSADDVDDLVLITDVGEPCDSVGADDLGSEFDDDWTVA